MEIIEAIAIIILILAILILIYYFLLNSPATFNKIKGHVSAGNNFYRDIGEKSSLYNDSVDDEDNNSMGEKIKIKLSDIDMSSFNTDAFFKRIDSFLDEKSDQLIQDWSLATKEDLSALEEKFNNTTKSVDNLENEFNKFKESSNEKFEGFEKRIKALEDS